MYLISHSVTGIFILYYVIREGMEAVDGLNLRFLYIRGLFILGSSNYIVDY